MSDAHHPTGCRFGLLTVLILLLAATGHPAAPLALRAPAHAGPPDPRIGPNLRLGEDPSALPAARRAQAEPHVARSFTDPNLLVAIFQEGRFEDGGAVNCGYAISRDGGTTWERGLIPHLIASLDGGPFERASDPVAGVDLAGTIYLNTLGINRHAQGLHPTIVLTKSLDGGRTFSAPLTVVTSTTANVMLDKNWMAVNTFPATPQAGRLAVTYTRFETLEDSQRTPIAVTLSDDGGVTWTAPTVVSPPQCQGSQPVFLPDGSLAIVYWNFAGPSGHRLEVAHSPDGGGAFAPPRPIAHVRLYDDPVARDGSFLPSATADRTLGVLYVAYQASWLGEPRILFTRSPDQGRTWTGPVPVNDTPHQRSVFNAAIAVTPDGQHVSVIFNDKRHDDGSGRWVDVYLAESFDGGLTWKPNLRLSEVPSDLQLAPLTGQGRMLGDYHAIVPALDFATPAFAVWIDTRTGSPDPFGAALTRTQGSSFEAWQQLAFTPAELADPARSGPAADADRDGLPNALEYALGLDPRRMDPSPVVIEPHPAGVALSLAPSAVATEVGFAWRGSEDLLSWTTVAPAEEGWSSGPRPDLRRYRALFPNQGALHYFRPGVELAPGSLQATWQMDESASMEAQ